MIITAMLKAFFGAGDERLVQRHALDSSPNDDQQDRGRNHPLADGFEDVGKTSGWHGSPRSPDLRGSIQLDPPAAAIRYPRRRDSHLVMQHGKDRAEARSQSECRRTGCAGFVLPLATR